MHGLLVTGPTTGKVTTFTDSEPFKITGLTEAGQGTLAGYIKIPKRAVITNASFNITTVPYSFNNYPKDVFVDIGDDGKYEWGFSGDGYGQLGQQKYFMDNKTRFKMELTGNDYNTTAKFRVPKNATVTSTMMKIDGRANVSGAIDSDWNSIKSSVQSCKVVANISEGPIYFARYSGYNFDIYDPLTSSWWTSSRCKDPLSGPGHNIALAGDDIYIFTYNWSTSTREKLYRYHTKNDTWKDLGALPIQNQNLMYGGLAYDQGSYLYAIQTVWSTSTTVAFYRYSILNNTWFKMKSPPSITARYPTLGYLDGRVYMMPYTQGGFGTLLYFYAPNNDTWFKLADVPGTKGVASRLCTDGYNMFGLNIDGEVLRYDVLTDTWAVTGKQTTNFISNWAGLAYSDRIFYVCNPFGTNIGYYDSPGDDGGIFPYKATLDIGDNLNTEWTDPDYFDSTDYVGDFTSELNSLITTTLTNYTDPYGNEFVDIVINVTSEVTSEFSIRNMYINYTYTEVVDKNPSTGSLLNALNELVPDVGEGNITFPIIVYSSSTGDINISNISIDYYIPDLTNDRLELINGHGTDGKIIYTDYMNYTFLVNITNQAGCADIHNVTLYLDADGENLQLLWDEATDTFSELRDPENLITLDIAASKSMSDSIARWSLEFVVRFDWAYPDQTLELCALKTTNDTNAFIFNYVEDVYRIECDLDFIDTLDVTSQFQGHLIQGDFVRGNEQITWSNLTVVYEGTTDIYPADKNFDVTITHNGTEKWVSTASSGVPFTLQTQVNDISDNNDSHHIDITDIPGFGTDISDISFLIRVDADGPGTPYKVLCHADVANDMETTVDDDTEIFITWDDATDGTGSGVIYHAMEFDNAEPTTIKTTKDSAIGAEGNATFYVRAFDKVGNWGFTASASIYIDLTNVTFVNPSPSSDDWQTNRTVTCGITIQDLVGSGVNVSTVQYRYVEEGNITNGSWLDYTGPGINGESVDVLQNITFTSDGVDKKVQWRAKDFVREYWLELEPPQKIKIDSIPATIDFTNPSQDEWLKTATPTINFYINDTNGSGVDSNSVEYAVSTTELDAFGSWQKITGVGTEESLYFTITRSFPEGYKNYLLVRASDVAGNDITFDIKPILLDLTTLEFLNPDPAPGTWLGDTYVTCNVTIRDLVSSIKTSSIKYSFSTNGTENYHNWKSVPKADIESALDGHTFNISIDVEFNNGVNNYLRWRAMDLVDNDVISNDYQIQIDINPIRFEYANPSSTDWVNSVSVPCSIVFNESSGSGVMVDTIEYSISINGPNAFGDWTTDGLEFFELIESNGDAQNSNLIYGKVRAEVTPTFVAGSNNFIHWRAKDVVHILAKSEPLLVNVDLENVLFSEPEPKEDKVYDELELRCKIVIKDNTDGSGVNPDSVQYRYSNTGPLGFSDWTNDSLFSDLFIFSVNLTFSPGYQNHIQWRAVDNAGNGPIESNIYTITINSPPMVIIDEPKEGEIFTNVDIIFFNANSTYDPDAGDVLTYHWSSNISKSIGNSEAFYSKLPLGMHEITLTVLDNHGKTVTASRVIHVKRYFLDTDSDGTPDYLDDNDDNDEVPDALDPFPLDPSEWEDTDGDGTGNNADDDDDNDGVKDVDDDFPLDKTKSKEEKSEEETGFLSMNLIIILLIIIFVILIAASLALHRRKKRAEEASTSIVETPSTIDKMPAAMTTSPLQTQESSPLLETTQPTTTTPLLPGTVHPDYAEVTQPGASPQTIVTQTAGQTEGGVPGASTQTVQSYIPPQSTANAPSFQLSQTEPAYNQQVQTQPTVPQPAPQPAPEPTTTTPTQPTTTAPTQPQTPPETMPDTPTSPAQDPAPEATKPSIRPGLTPEQQKGFQKNTEDILD